MDYTHSRFFRITDPSSREFIFPLPNTWETRFYEYEWVKQFAHEKDTVLDAACGIAHPLKFYLANVCRSVYACDIDQRILSKEAILHDAVSTYPRNVEQQEIDAFLQNIDIQCCSLTQLPYEDKLFDKVFCISVLEHLSQEDSIKSFLELKRVLKDDGQMIFTFDYPTISIETLTKIIDITGLTFYDYYTLSKPDDAIVSRIWQELNCFRAVLKKV
ncbi:methyltransferase domain-containing protein [Agaribacter marinus]|uniref:Class I SAM-dependent methyltransferase n=1 Tax=Virgibacillus salarius TaxID=447199 RepID=A0A941I836_9BACI|nr:class I SAM-dependent methyltransferase [Virgibacillus salarius]MBR7795184.1 class I SAM-dependent methyltransferase [Virgibacillus salarius]NAZ07900.1 methyltransferase domain-containing protein [Agaribacter marinus]WBX81609.1 class I SAM-dependent methyltransferase [Virgibacillus salarius]